MKLPQFYTINIGNYTDSSLRLSKETNYEPIQKGKIYTLKDLAEFDMFAGDKRFGRMVSHQRCNLEILRGR